MTRERLILGAGVTGLAAGWTSGARILDAGTRPGGICRSYFVRPGTTTALASAPRDGEAYRFEIGGGHWIFGGDPVVARLLARFGTLERYTRRAAIYFPQWQRVVPYPLQYHLSHLPPDVAAKAVAEMTRPRTREASTLAGWLEQSFGPTLMDVFFAPFHQAYTAGLWRHVAWQDAYKTPLDIERVKAGAAGDRAPLAGTGHFDHSSHAGYNESFLYPVEGLAALCDRMSAFARIRYDSRVVDIDLDHREVACADGSVFRWDRMISTLPLSHMAAFTGIDRALTLTMRPEPSTSVLVLNVGATRGARCPDAHWVYVPGSRAGFHRVGFYSNVDASFLPVKRRTGDAVSVYVERAYVTASPPTAAQISAYARDALTELREWGFIGDVEALHATWIPVAYTWSRPGSRWAASAVRLLAERNVLMAGRYGQWRFQGIAQSVRDGLRMGLAVRSSADAVSPVSAVADLRRLSGVL